MQPYFQPETPTNFDRRFMHKVHELFSADYELSDAEGFYAPFLTIPSRGTEKEQQ